MCYVFNAMIIFK